MVAMCPVCGLKAPGAYCDEPIKDDQSDSIESIAEDVGETRATLNQVLSELKSLPRSTAWGFFWFMFSVFLIANWPGSSLDRWTDRVWYSARYDVSFANVTVEKRPRDCDFLHAPVGNKECDYEKGTSVFGAEQREALIQHATTREGTEEAAKQPNAVVVYWQKKQD